MPNAAISPTIRRNRLWRFRRRHRPAHLNADAAYLRDAALRRLASANGSAANCGRAFYPSTAARWIVDFIGAQNAASSHLRQRCHFIRFSPHDLLYLASLCRRRLLTDQASHRRRPSHQIEALINRPAETARQRKWRILSFRLFISRRRAVCTADAQNIFIYG